MTLSLYQSGQRITRWTSCEIERGLDTFAHRLSLSFVDSSIRTEDDNTLVFLRDLDIATKIQAYWDSELLFTGRVERLSTRAVGGAITWTADGRSLTGDLVDCSATHRAGTWTSTTASQIAADLCKPFEISVTSRASDTEKFSRFAIIEGESVHDAIDRLCKVRGMLPVTTPAGNVELLRFLAELDPYGPNSNDVQNDIAVLDAAAPTLADRDQFPRLVAGIDLNRCYERSYELDYTNRYSRYLLHASQVDDSSSTILDYMGRFRPLVVVGDSTMTRLQADTRARWERSVRAGRSERLRLSHAGATAPDGLTFSPAKPVTVTDPALGVILFEAIVARSVLRVSESEIVTELELCKPETFSLREYSESIATGTTKTGKALKKKTKAPK